MRILAIYPYTHISSAALLINGKLVSASAEERFNRIKMSTDFPDKSIEWCLRSNNLKIDDIDEIVIPWNPGKNIANASNRWTSEIRWRGELLSNIPSRLLRIKNGEEPDQILTKIDNLKIKFLNHHECHAASAFYTSGFKEANILTIDGHGENETCFIGDFNKNQIRKLFTIQYPHSVGLLYGTFTNFLGFKPDHDEWKVMALSSYASKKNKYDSIIENIYSLNDNGFELNLRYFSFYTFDRQKNFFSNEFEKLFGLPRLKNTKLLRRHFEIAGALQRSFSKIVNHLIKKCKSINRASNNLILSGGAAMNCVFNGTLQNNKYYKNNFISGYPDDLGVSIGACYLAYFKNKKRSKFKRERSCFFGPKFSDKEIKHTLDRYRIAYNKPNNIFKTTASLLSNGKLIGWFQDNMEFSHRALGNRSILADPRQKSMKDKINRAIKYREYFRPFAPATLEEYCNGLFFMEKKEKIDFMEKAVVVKKKWRKKIPAVTHFDYTARVQTVSKLSNPKFYKLIQNFYQLTGVPAVINTSFNINGEPIVMSPTDAIRTFYSCGLDYLILGPYIISK